MEFTRGSLWFNIEGNIALSGSKTRNSWPHSRHEFTVLAKRLSLVSASENLLIVQTLDWKQFQLEENKWFQAKHLGLHSSEGQSPTLLIELMKLSNLLVSSVDCQNSRVIRWPICVYFYCSFPALDRLFMDSPYVYFESRMIQMTTFSCLLYKASVPLKRLPFAINIMLDGSMSPITAFVNAINLQGVTLSSNRTTLA